ncbi:MAG: hypothetical protein MI757_07095 [Pirellulales bacterium]|nr:hypothetical protein [Pirellulales bacterium]
MTRRVIRANANQVSLFPFLAVLVCTMGALLVLLVVMAHQARLRAATVPSPENPPPAPAPASNVSADELAKAEEEINRRLLRIQELLKKTKEGLNQQNLELAHLEEDMRRWQNRLAELRREYERLKDVGTSTDEQQQIMRDELARLKEDISLSAQLLADEQKRLMSKPKSFSLIPYDGARGTYRRPLYVECSKGKVTLQPLGIELRDSDFPREAGPENPLASALRAMRQYLAKQSPQTVGQEHEPYPLLVVRPDGVNEYYASRSAIKSWGPDFGYEFVEQERELDWGQPDPKMAQVVQAAIDQARVQQRALMRAAPRRYRDQRLRGTGTGSGGGDRFGSGPSGGGGNFGRGSSGSGGPLASGDGSGAARGDGSRTSAGRYDPSRGQGNAQVGSARPGEVKPGAQGGLEGGTAGGDANEGGTLHSIAASRGRNWALPQKRRGSIAYSRPISLEVRADRLVFPNYQGEGREITLGPRTKDSIDQVVAVVWKQMESWGSAGNGAYWKPVLKCDVAADARSRYRALTILLMESGVDITIKTQ